MIPPEAVRHALLDLVASILVHVRVFTAGGCRGRGLSAEHCCQLYRLADMSHNIPAIVEGTYTFGFDEEWLLSELSAFDHDYGSQLAQEYREALKNNM